MWTSKTVYDFIALGAVLMYDSYVREIVILSMMKMNTFHTAEHVKACIETMINKFSFNKEKISCN